MNVTVRPTSIKRIAISEGAREALHFERGWNVFLDGKHDSLLWVGQSADGRMYGLLGAEILLVTGPQRASRIAYATWQRAQARRQP